MSVDVEAPITVPRSAAVRPRRGRWIALAVVAALALGLLVSAYTYRRTVTSERDATFMAVVQAQTKTAYEAMARVGWKQMPADAVAMSDLVRLELAYRDPNHRITVTTPAMRLGGETQLLRLDAEMFNYDLPGWVGERSGYMSLLLFGTYTNDANGSSSDEGSCVIRLGSPYDPVLTETVDFGNGYFANPCTPEQLASIGIS